MHKHYPYFLKNCIWLSTMQFQGKIPEPYPELFVAPDKMVCLIVEQHEVIAALQGKAFLISAFSFLQNLFLEGFDNLPIIFR